MLFSLLKKASPYDHWEYKNLENGNFIRIVPERGGLITGWCCNNRDILYLDLERFKNKDLSVRGGIPILFPICGDLPDNTFNFQNQQFSMKQHGFARNTPWSLETINIDKFITLTLENSLQTERIYPFKFLIKIQIQLLENALAINANVKNLDKKKMQFCFGLHPYFKITDLNNLIFEGLPDFCQNQIDNSTIKTNKQLSKLSTGVDFLCHPNGFVSFTDMLSGHKLEMQNYSPLDLTVIWTEPHRKMLCLEPWTSPRGALNTGKRIINLNSGDELKLKCKFVSN